MVVKPVSVRSDGQEWEVGRGEEGESTPGAPSGVPAPPSGVPSPPNHPTTTLPTSPPSLSCHSQLPSPPSPPWQPPSPPPSPLPSFPLQQLLGYISSFSQQVDKFSHSFVYHSPSHLVMTSLHLPDRHKKDNVFDWTGLCFTSNSTSHLPVPRFPVPTQEFSTSSTGWPVPHHQLVVKCWSLQIVFIQI